MAGWPSSRGSSISAGAGQIGSPTLTSTWNRSWAVARPAASRTRTPVLILVADDLGGHVIEFEFQTVVDVFWERRAGNRNDVLADGLDIVGCLQSRKVD